MVTENFAPGVLARLGFSYDELRAIKPDIIYVSNSGFGHVGPYRAFKTWGPLVQASCGLAFMTGLDEHRPAGIGYSYMDHLGANFMAIAILSGLLHRNRTARGPVDRPVMYRRRRPAQRTDAARLHGQPPATAPTGFAREQSEPVSCDGPARHLPVVRRGQLGRHRAVATIATGRPWPGRWTSSGPGRQAGPNLPVASPGRTSLTSCWLTGPDSHDRFEARDGVARGRRAGRGGATTTGTD